MTRKDGSSTTFDAATGQPTNDQPRVVRAEPILANIPTTPSIISIPPQISTTLVWVAVGIGIGLWISHALGKSRQRTRD